MAFYAALGINLSPYSTKHRYSELKEELHGTMLGNSKAKENVVARLIINCIFGSHCQFQ